MNDEPPRVAYQGAPGAFSEEAIHACFAGAPVVCVPFPDFASVGAAVRRGVMDFGMLPVENSTAGRVLAATEVLGAGDLVQVEEVVLRIRLCLLGMRDARVDGLRCIISHPVALAQCTRFLRQLEGVQSESFYDTAGAAAEVAQRRDVTLGALAAGPAAERYDLDILARDVHDDPANRTRFVLVERSVGRER